MGKRRKLKVINGRYAGEYLDEKDCQTLDKLRELDKEHGCISDLKKIICELEPHVVNEIIRTKSTDGNYIATGTLKNEQTIGVAYMYFAKRLILGDSVGLGKTVEVCGLCNLLETEYAKKGQDFKFLYLTDKKVLPQAQAELIRFTGNYVESVRGVKAQVQRFFNENREELLYSVVGSHSLLTHVIFQDFMRLYQYEAGYNPFDLLVIDECGSILKNSATKTYKDCKYIADMFDRVVMLNATPFEKELRMFYNQLNFIDDTFLPTKTAFSSEYEIMDYRSAPYPVFSGKYKNELDFREKVGYRYFARTRKSIGAKMVDCTADVVVVPLSSEQRSLLRRTSMSQMVYDCPSYFNMGVDTNESTTPKLKALIELFDGDLEHAESVLVYSRYKEAQAAIQRVLMENGIDSYIMNGDTSNADRDRIINRFKLGEIRVLITNVQKGLNFGNCNYCVFYDYDPNPNNMVQFEGRMTRSNDIVNKHVYLFVTRGRELDSLKDIVAERAEASDLFAGSDFSCVLSILLDNDKIENLE